MKKLVFFVFSTLFVFGATIFFRLGGHKSVRVEYAEHPELALLYKEHIGPYHKINDVIVEVEKWALTQHLPCQRTFGEYIDNPRLVDERRLRSHGGCVLEGATSEFIASLNSATAGITLPTGVQAKVLPKQKYVIAYFDGAPSISPFKVYPKVEEFLAEQKLKTSGSVYEIYSIRSGREASTEYLFLVDDSRF